MPGSAPRTTAFLGNLKTSFGQGANPLSTPVMNAPGMVTTPSPNQTLEQLEILDRVLQEVAQSQGEPEPPTPPESSPLPASPIPSAPSSAAPVTSPLQAVSAAVPLAIDQATNTLNPATPVGTTAKEAIDRGVTIEQPTVDTGTGAQVVEVEKTPEIPVEVESYLQKVEDHQDQLPEEIVIAGDTAQLIPPAQQLKPVIVLPITREMEQAGLKKSSQWSIRWLVEWSRRLMKMFSGKILYAEAEE